MGPEVRVKGIRIARFRKPEAQKPWSGSFGRNTKAEVIITVNCHQIKSTDLRR